MNLTSQRYGRLTVISFVGMARRSRRLWACRCECGTDLVVTSDNLQSGNTQSCGCLRRDQNPANATKHGHAAHGETSSEYNCWSSMKHRCYNPRNKRFAGYGGRGITVCERWLHDFEAFLADMGRRPAGRHGKGAAYSIDRIDNDGNYEPGNCRWATYQEQNNNQRKQSRKAATKGKQA